MCNIQIKNEGFLTKVIIDGHDYSDSIRSISFTQDAVQRPVLRLDFLADNVTLDTTAIPELPEPYKAFYKKVTDPEETEPVM